MKNGTCLDSDINNDGYPSDTSAHTAPEMPTTKHQTQCLNDRLIFDLLVGRLVSVDYPERVPTLFLKWKDSLPPELSYFVQYHDIPPELRNLADSIIDRLEGEIDHSLIEKWNLGSISVQLKRFITKKHSSLEKVISTMSSQLEYNTEETPNALQLLEEELAQLSGYVNQPVIDFAEMPIVLYHQFREYFFLHKNFTQFAGAGFPIRSSTSEKCQHERPSNQFRFSPSPIVAPQRRPDETEEYTREDSFRN